MAGESSFGRFIDQFQDGDEDAKAEVFQRFVNRLIGLARTRLDTQIRQKEDPEDVVQSVFKSFFNRQAKGQYNIKNWESLWSLLALITVRKCINRLEHWTAQRRNVNREVVYQPQLIQSDESLAVWEAISGDPTTSQAAIFAEIVEIVMRELDEKEREILSLRLQGYAIPEISPLVGCTEYMVKLVIKQVKERLRQLFEE